jgi:hypothetical protein
VSDAPDSLAATVRITGGASPTDVAAIIAVITSMQVAQPAERPRRVWGAPSSGLRTMPTPGPRAWRTSALPC